jgi:hypothetical protein
MRTRILKPELLDLLAADDPRAMQSRRDLARINAVMRQQAIMADALSRLPAPALLADLGGGDGIFLLGVARRLAARWPGVKAVILDQKDIVTDQTRTAFEKLGWSCETRAGDIFDTLPRLDADIVTANLFLHHFEDAALVRLLALVAVRAKAFVAAEPRRSRLALAASYLVGLLGANDVSRHDAVASVRAGFTGHDISMLWTQSGQWTLGERAAFPFSHVFSCHAG